MRFLEGRYERSLRDTLVAPDTPLYSLAARPWPLRLCNIPRSLVP